MTVVETVDRRPVPGWRRSLYLLGALVVPGGAAFLLQQRLELLDVANGIGVLDLIVFAVFALLALCVYAVVIGGVEAAVRAVQLRREAARRRASEPEDPWPFGTEELNEQLRATLETPRD